MADRGIIRRSLPFFAPALVLTAALAAVVYLLLLPSLEQRYQAQRLDLCQRLVESALSDLAARQQSVAAGEIDRPTAEARAIARLRSLRFGAEGKDYFWIIGPDDRFLMHPYRPDLEGVDPSRALGPDGEPVAGLIDRMRQVTGEKGQGVLSYHWHWKDDLDRLEGKLSYVARFEPWGWTVGTGVYTDEMAADLANLRDLLLLTGLLLVGLAAATALLLSWRIRRAEERERQFRDRLRQAQKLELVGRLAGGVAHDFNNILGALIASADHLEHELPAGSRLREPVHMIQQGCQRAADLTRKLLTFARKDGVCAEVLDVQRPLMEALGLARRSFASGHRIVTEFAPGTLPVTGDATLLQGAFLNLLVNARDAMPDGGELEVTARWTDLAQPEARALDLARGAHAEIVIADTGTGIPEAVQDHLFEPFYTTKPAGAGTGLGLSLVYGTVREHGGQVVIESAPGQGTSVRVLLPLSAEAAASGEPAIADAPTPVTGS